MKQTHDVLPTLVQGPAERMVKCLADSLKKQADSLSVIAGGGEKSRNWYAGAPPDIKKMKPEAFVKWMTTHVKDFNAATFEAKITELAAASGKGNVQKYAPNPPAKLARHVLGQSSTLSCWPLLRAFHNIAAT